MQLLLMTQQIKRVDKPNQSEIMIAVKVRNKNMRYTAAADLVIDHLYLRALAAIHQEIVSIQRNHLAGRVTVKSRNSRIISEDRNCEHVAKILS